MLSGFGVAQNNVNSPYSGFGIGDISPRTNIVLGSMGGVGYALQNPYYINFKNPAAFAAFDSLSFIGDLSFNITNQTLKAGGLEHKSSFLQLDYLTIGLPVLKVWRTSAGIMPFSDIGYNILNIQYVDSSFNSVTNRYEGTGGLHLLYWGNAFKICKGLTLGVNISYLFGTINTMRFAEYEIENTLNMMAHRFRHIDGIHITGGLQYQTAIKEKHLLSFGAVYENAIKIWSKENFLALTYIGEYSQMLTFDTVRANIGDAAERGKLKLPQCIGGGIAYGYKENLVASVDITWQNWKNFDMSNSNDVFQNNLITAIGIQYVPNPMSSKYYNRINLRAGTRISSGYIILNNTPIPEFAISAGLGLPIRTINSRSSVNIMFEYCRLGSVQNNLIVQNYYKLSFNFILQEKWYQRRKLD